LAKSNLESGLYVNMSDIIRIPCGNVNAFLIKEEDQAVLPQYQRQGVGKALIHSMIDNARSLNYGAIMFFGRPEYYPQFGFIESDEYGVTDCCGENYPAFMAMELMKGYLADVRGGKYYESDIYDDSKNGEAVKKFDKSFR
jgi:predicted N-acetyltransferase YhbS